MKFNIITLCCLLFVLPFKTFSQNWSWAFALDSSSIASSAGEVVTADDNGNIYLGGHFYFDGINLGNNYLTIDGNSDLFMSKIDCGGQMIWANQSHSDLYNTQSYADQFTGIATDREGNIYACGDFSDSMRWDSFTLSDPLCSEYCYMPFVISFDPLGNVRWAKEIPTETGSAEDMIIIGDDIYITGRFKDSAQFDAVHLNTINSWGSDGYIAKMNSNGDYVWVKQIGLAAYGPEIHSIEFDNNGSIIFSGTMGDSCLFDAQMYYGIGLTYGSLFVAKYDTSGNHIWVAGGLPDNFYGTKGYFTGLTTDTDGNIYLAGIFDDSLKIGSFILLNDVQQYPHRNFAAKLDSNGNVLWAEQYGSIPNGQAFPPTIEISSSGQLHLSTHFSGTASFGSYNFSSQNSSLDFCVAELDVTDGSVLFAKAFGGNGFEQAFDFYSDKIGNSYLAGFTGSSTFVIDTITVYSTYADIFIAKSGDNCMVNVEEHHPNTKNSIFPNPFFDKVFLDLTDGLTNHQVTISIYNLQSKELFSTSFFSQGTEEFNLDLLESGVYLDTLQSNNEVVGNGMIICID